MPGVEVEQPTQTSEALDGVGGSVVVARYRLWVNESTYSEDHKVIQSLVAHCPHKPFRKCVAVRTLRQNGCALDAFGLQHRSKGLGEQRIAIVDQVRGMAQETVLRIGQIASHLKHPSAIGGNAELKCWKPAMLTASMQPAPRHRYTFQEYLELEEISGVRHEFFDGEIYAMAGGTPEHAAMAAAIVLQLGPQQQGCRVYSSDLRVPIVATGLATYPDVTVVCGPSQRDPNSPPHVNNPKVVFEVMSRGTEQYYRGEKIEHYKQEPSLEAILLVN